MPNSNLLFFQAIVRAVNKCRDTNNYREQEVHAVIEQMLQHILRKSSELNADNLHDMFAIEPSLEQEFMTLLEAPDNTLTPYSLVQELRSLFDDVDKKDCAHTMVHGNNQSKKADTDEIGNKDASWKEFTPPSCS